MFEVLDSISSATCCNLCLMTNVQKDGSVGVSHFNLSLSLSKIPRVSRVVKRREMALLGIPKQQLIITSKPQTGSRLQNRVVVSCKGVGFQPNSRMTTMCSSSTIENYQQQKQKKVVWIWTESKQVMTTAVERGWNTFIFTSHNRQLATEWSSIALIDPLFLGGDGEILDSEHKRVATFSEISSPQQLQQLQPDYDEQQPKNVIISLPDWQVIPAENIIAAFHGSQKTVFAISKTPSEARIFLEALELGLGGIVLKVEDVDAVLELKEYVDRRNEEGNQLNLTKVTVKRVQIAGMGDRVCVDLCSLMRPGEGLLVGSFARGLFLVHSECLESNYIASRPFRVNAGPVHSYVAVPGGKTSYLSELEAGKEVIVVDQSGQQRTAIVGRVKIEKRPLILVEATELDNQNSYSVLLQNAETVGLVSPRQGSVPTKTAIAVTSLKVGDEVMLRLQGGARHTGIEIQEFIVEK